MSGWRIRLQLWLKLWFTSVQGIVMLLLLPIVAYAAFSIEIPPSYRVGSPSSILYEKIGTLFYAVILQWCFSIDFDSKFYGQMVTYPYARWKIIVERWLLSTLLLIGSMSVVTIALTSLAGRVAWQGLFFAIPWYIGIGGVMVLAAIIGLHSLGGLMAGLLGWLFTLTGGVSIYYDRAAYIGLGMLSIALATFLFHRKTV